MSNGRRHLNGLLGAVACGVFAGGLLIGRQNSQPGKTPLADSSGAHWVPDRSWSASGDDTRATSSESSPLPFDEADGIPDGAARLGAGADATRAEHGARNVEPERPRFTPALAVSPEEWAQAEAFLKENSPLRFERLMKVPDEEQRRRLHRFLVTRYRAIAALRSSAPELYKTRVEEVRADDEVFGILQELHRGGNKQALRARLRTVVERLVNLGLTDRAQRISMLENALSDQKKALENDSRNKEQIVEEQFNSVLRDGVNGFGINGRGLGGKHHSPGEIPTTGSASDSASPAE